MSEPASPDSSRRDFLRLIAAGAATAAGGLAACRARGLDPVRGRLPLASGMTEGLSLPAPTAAAGAGDVVPAAFVGHGSPMTILDSVRGAIWTKWAESMPRPRAILVVSAHWEENPLMIGATTRVPLVYDYYGFPDEMYAVRYDAPPAPELATRVEALLRPVRKTDRDAERGLDHGAFAPLKWMYPRADVPVLEISIPTDDGKVLFDIGRALAPLRREGVLVLGSGNVTHNLGRTGRGGTPAWASDFDAWAAQTLAAGDADALIDYRRKAPALAMAHPTLDHWLPMLVVAGAGEGRPATFPVTGWEGGSISRRCVQIA